MTLGTAFDTSDDDIICIRRKPKSNGLLLVVTGVMVAGAIGFGVFVAVYFLKAARTDQSQDNASDYKLAAPSPKPGRFALVRSVRQSHEDGRRRRDTGCCHRSQRPRDRSADPDLGTEDHA